MLRQIIPVLLVLVLMLSYLEYHLFTLFSFSKLVQWCAVVIFTIGIVAFFLSMTRVIDALPLPVARFAYNFGSSVLFLSAYLLLVFILLDILRLVHIVPAGGVRGNVLTATAVTVLMTVLSVYGHLHYLDKKRVALPLPATAQLSRPLKIVAASDLHLGYHNRRKELERWVEKINSESPDVVLFAGDIVDRSMRPLVEEGMDEVFRTIKAPVFACLGNHEYYATGGKGLGEVKAFYAAAGITLLQDSVAYLDGIAIVGRDDRTNASRQSLADLLKGVDAYTILLDHQPYNLEEAERGKVNFQFSGHTHRGQFWPASLITTAVYECAWGAHQRGATSYYVSSGLGIWGPKFRIGTQSEYIVVEIGAR